MTERRLDSLSPGLGEDSQSRRDGRSAARLGGALAATLLLATASPQVLALLRQASPQIVANMPLDYDGISVYDVEPWEPISAFLLERAGLRQGAVEAAFQALGQARQPPADLAYRRQLLRAAGSLAQTRDAVLTPFASKIFAHTPSL